MAYIMQEIRLDEHNYPFWPSKSIKTIEVKLFECIYPLGSLHDTKFFFNSIPIQKQFEELICGGLSNMDYDKEKARRIHISFLSYFDDSSANDFTELSQHLML